MGRKWAGWSMVLIGEGGQVGQDLSWWILGPMVLGGAVALVADWLCSTVWKGGGGESLACKDKSLMEKESSTREKCFGNQPAGWWRRLPLGGLARH